MSSTALPLLTGFVAGATAGLVYFSALWLAVRGLTTEGSLRKLVLGAVLRLGMVLGALWLALAAGVSGPTALMAVLGFVAVRLAATRLISSTTAGG